jgi:chitinase
MNPRFLICMIAAVISLAGADLKAAQPEFRIVGYLPEYRMADFDLSDAQLYTDLIVFSAEPTPEGELNMARLAGVVPWDKLRKVKTAYRVRLLLCVGGWERSGHFAAMTRSEGSRNRFVEAAIRVCLSERLDGLDLDWEHPADTIEADRYGKLLVALYRALKPHGLILSVTIAAWQKLSLQAITSVDIVNLMAYDHDGCHATFDTAAEDVKTLIDMGVPAGKIILGLPFYGRHVTKREQTATYREILTKYHPGPEVDEIDGIYFNGQSTIRHKTEYAIQTRLGGVMIWEAGQDVPGERSLLKVIRDTADRAGKVSR